MNHAKPFLKWAGGKRQLLNEIEKNLPPDISKTRQIDLYIEPFVGGGALLFYLLSNYSVNKSIINDINPDLILAYKIVKLYPEDLIKKLKIVKKEYLSLPYEERKEYYYNNLRNKFNELKINYSKPDTKLSIEKVALLIALNKTCFNGLYRQNNKGEFNVPIGRYKNPRILDEENVRRASTVLKNTQIFYGSYDSIKIPKEPKTFVYLDPPYRPLTAVGFTKYSKEDFNDKDQKQLAGYYKKLNKDRHYLLLSNSDPKDKFFDTLYKGFNIERVSAKRYINSKANGRGNINELLIKNY